MDHVTHRCQRDEDKKQALDMRLLWFTSYVTTRHQESASATEVGVVVGEQISGIDGDVDERFFTRAAAEVGVVAGEPVSGRDVEVELGSTVGGEVHCCSKGWYIRA
jgi:hypothetical protein